MPCNQNSFVKFSKDNAIEGDFISLVPSQAELLFLGVQPGRL